MSTRSQLTKDLNESVKSLLGKHVKILLKNVVRLETKGDKTENRVLVFSPCRLFLLTAKVPTRIDCHFHYLEIQAIESKRGNQLSIVVGEKVYSFLTGDDSMKSHEVDSMVAALATAIRNIFPNVPLQYIIRKIDIIPNSRLQFLQDDSVTPGRPNSGPCGGFSTQYACMCDYHALPYREEVAWDVDTIYNAHDSREICLKDFEHLDQKDLVPIISALEYNTWFTSLRVASRVLGPATLPVRLSHESAERILHIMRKSLSIEELHLDNLGLKADFAHKLSLSLIANQATPLHTIDLSHNMIEDKGAMHLSGPVARVPKGLVRLSLAHCGLTAKGVNQLAHAMSLNKSMHTSLTHLDLSGNNLKDDINNLYNFLAQPNAISYLDIASTETTLESLFGALLRGCATNLSHLNVSRNPFSTKKSKEVPPSFKQFFTSTLSLKYLNMAYCKLPLEALKHLLLGLACNESTTEMHLDLSNNTLGTHGAHVLESCIHGVRCISTLDISDNNMDVELAPVITAIGKNKSLKHLHMGRNVNNMKAKHIGSIMDALVQMIQEEDCVLESLYIPDSKLKSDLYNLINALGSNQCLQTIDISGNFMGDSGARLLAKALQINNRLRTIIYDKNNITVQGYSDLAYALESNYTLRYIPFPIYDVTPCMKTNAERTDYLMRKIQDLLHRNVSPKKYSNGNAYRLQQGFLLSSTQQMVDRLVVQTQDTIKTLAAESCDMNNDINHATALIQDADNSKHILPRLQEVVQRRDESNPVEIKLKLMSEELHGVVTSYLQGSLDSMLACAGDQCPLLLSSDRYRRELRQACTEKTSISESFIRTCLQDQAGTEIINRINSINLAVAANLSEKITDEAVEQLSRCHRALVGAAPHYIPPRSPYGSIDSEPTSSADNTSQMSDQSPMATPHMSMKRKSLHGRKMRPKSVVDSVEGLSADDIPGMLPPLNLSLPSGTHLPRSAEESLDSVAELPNATQQLQHLVKGRPRRAKTRAPTRPMLKPADMFEDLGEGLDTFFRPGSVTPTTPLISPTSDECSSLSFQADGSPNHRYNSLTSGETTPVLNDDRKVKLGRSSPLLKGVCGLLEPAPRSRSSDNLEKYSPLIGRRSQGDSPLTASPLAKRATDDSPTISRENSSSSICQDKKHLDDHRKVKVCPVAEVIRSPTNGLPKGGSDVPKSPILKSLKDSSNTPSKPRPWSMSSDRKSGEFSLLSDGSSPNTSTGNTPDSGDALDDVPSECSERRSVRDMAAGINRNGSDKKDSESTPKWLESHPIPAPRKLIPGKIIPSILEEKLVDGLKLSASNPLYQHKGKLLNRSSLTRDDNYNFDDSIDV